MFLGDVNDLIRWTLRRLYAINNSSLVSYLYLLHQNWFDTLFLAIVCLLLLGQCTLTIINGWAASNTDYIIFNRFINPEVKVSPIISNLRVSVWKIIAYFDMMKMARLAINLLLLLLATHPIFVFFSSTSMGYSSFRNELKLLFLRYTSIFMLRSPEMTIKGWNSITLFT